MKTNVLTADTNLQNALIKHYNNDIKPNNNQYIKCFVQAKNFTISIYTSGKVVFQGKDAETEIEKWQTTQLSLFTEDVAKNSSTRDIKANYIGCDEVGTGDVFGPVCVCACYLDENDLEFIDSLNIKDSKQLNDVYISEIAPKLMQKLKYSLIIINNSKYNQLFENNYNQGAIKAYAHNLAILDLTSRLDKDVTIMMDQFVNERKYYEYLQREPKIKRGLTFETKAENKYLAVALASIIARFAFVQAMDTISFQLDKTIPKGAGPKVDDALAIVIDTYGQDVLDSVTKKHFINVQRLL